MKILKVLVASAIILFLLTPNIYSGGPIKASAIPTSSTAIKNQKISVPIIVDVSAFPEKLGSYTATLTWDAQVLKYLSYYPGDAKGFTSPLVNIGNISDGKLILAAANPFGSEGIVKILNVKFEVIGSEGTKSDLKLEFTAMAAAYTFLDLLPYLETESTGTDQKIMVNEKPKKFSLLQNYPNPFNLTTKITYKLPKAEYVNLSIYDLGGKKLITLVDDKREIGNYDVYWDGKDELHKEMPAGFFIYKLQAGSFSDEKKMQLTK
jgi:hypothetical protein